MFPWIFLLDLEMLLLCECARLNAVIVRGMPEEHLFMVHKYALPAGDSPRITLIAINAGRGENVARGHYERLDCLTRVLPPQGEPGASSDKQGSSGRNGCLSGVRDGMQVDGKGSALGLKPQFAPPPDVPDGADGRSGRGTHAERKVHEAEAERGSSGRKLWDGC